MLLFKIPMGMRNNIFEVFTQFGHAPSKMFPSPAVGYAIRNVGGWTLKWMNGTQQLLVYADDAYCMREYMDTKQGHGSISPW